jgi:flagellar biosynthetic protein FliO
VADTIAASAAASAAAPAASATDATRPALGTTIWPELMSTVLALLLVLALAWLLLRWLRRSQTGGTLRDGPQVLRSVSVGARERLVVVEHHGVEYLLGVTAASISVIERRRVGATPPQRVEPTL